MNTRNAAKATTLVATAILAMTAGLTSAHADTSKAATANPIESTSATDPYQQSLTAEDGTVVTFTLDPAAQTLTVTNTRGDREVVTVPEDVMRDLTSDAAAATPGAISPQRVSVETCKNILSAAGYANGIVWTLATIAAAPTLAGSLVGAGARVITSAMITEAGRLCK